MSEYQPTTYRVGDIVLMKYGHDYREFKVRFVVDCGRIAFVKFGDDMLRIGDGGREAFVVAKNFSLAMSDAKRDGDIGSLQSTLVWVVFSTLCSLLLLAAYVAFTWASRHAS